MRTLRYAVAATLLSFCFASVSPAPPPTGTTTYPANKVWLSGEDKALETAVTDGTIPTTPLDATDLGANSVGAEELDETAVESELEGVLDLEDLQGALPNNSIDNTEIDEAMNPTWTGDHDYGGGTLQVPNSITLPANCEVGDSYMDTDAPTGERYYLCESTDTWVKQGGSPAPGITSIFGCTGPTCPDLTPPDGAHLDLGANVDAQQNDEGLSLPRPNDCSNATGNGQVCYDADDKVVYVGDGTTANMITSTGASGWDFLVDWKDGSNGIMYEISAGVVTRTTNAVSCVLGQDSINDYLADAGTANQNRYRVKWVGTPDILPAHLYDYQGNFDTCVIVAPSSTLTAGYPDPEVKDLDTNDATLYLDVTDFHPSFLALGADGLSGGTGDDADMDAESVIFAFGNRYSTGKNGGDIDDGLTVEGSMQIFMAHDYDTGHTEGVSLVQSNTNFLNRDTAVVGILVDGWKGSGGGNFSPQIRCRSGDTDDIGILWRDTWNQMWGGATSLWCGTNLLVYGSNSHSGFSKTHLDSGSINVQFGDGTNGGGVVFDSACPGDCTFTDIQMSDFTLMNGSTEGATIHDHLWFSASGRPTLIDVRQENSTATWPILIGPRVCDGSGTTPIAAGLAAPSSADCAASGGNGNFPTGKNGIGGVRVIGGQWKQGVYFGDGADGSKIFLQTDLGGNTASGNVFDVTAGTSITIDLRGSTFDTADTFPDYQFIIHDRNVVVSRDELDNCLNRTPVTSEAGAARVHCVVPSGVIIDDFPVAFTPVHSGDNAHYILECDGGRFEVPTSNSDADLIMFQLDEINISPGQTNNTLTIKDCQFIDRGTGINTTALNLMANGGGDRFGTVKLQGVSVLEFNDSGDTAVACLEVDSGNDTCPTVEATNFFSDVTAGVHFRSVPLRITASRVGQHLDQQDTSICYISQDVTGGEREKNSFVQSVGTIWQGCGGGFEISDHFSSQGDVFKNVGGSSGWFQIGDPAGGFNAATPPVVSIDSTFIVDNGEHGNTFLYVYEGGDIQVDMSLFVETGGCNSGIAGNLFGSDGTLISSPAHVLNQNLHNLEIRLAFAETSDEDCHLNTIVHDNTLKMLELGDINGRLRVWERDQVRIYRGDDVSQTAPDDELEAWIASRHGVIFSDQLGNEIVDCQAIRRASRGDLCVEGDDGDVWECNNVATCTADIDWLQLTSSGAAGWEENSNLIDLVQNADEVGIGTAATTAQKVIIQNDATDLAGAFTLVLKAVAGQTGDILVIQNSAGTELISFDINGQPDLAASGVAGHAMELKEDADLHGDGTVDTWRVDLASFDVPNGGFSVTPVAGQGGKLDGSELVADATITPTQIDLTTGDWQVTGIVAGRVDQSNETGATKALTAEECKGDVWTNRGAVAATAYTLPTAAQGLYCVFVQVAAQRLSIDSQATNNIFLGTSGDIGAGDCVDSPNPEVIGNQIGFLALDDNDTWMVISERGTWTDSGPGCG